MLVPIAGGAWNNGSGAGVWAVNWNNARTNSNDNVGFRADCAPASHPARGWWRRGRRVPAPASCRGEICRRALPGSRATGERQRPPPICSVKTVGGLFDRATSADALYEGYLAARRGKRAGRACYEFERRIGAHIDHMAAALAAGTYRPRPYGTFWVTAPKRRMITAPAFRDRVVQHAIYNAVRPVFDATFIDQNFACRVGKGTHAAADYVQAAIRSSQPDSWALQMDVRRFYPSIDRGVLRELYERRLRERRMVDLMMLFADDPAETGIPIGNLLSQLGALVYLNPLDHFVKRVLKVERYCRYVDDFVLVGLTRERALQCQDAIGEFLATRLHLGLSWSDVFTVSRGIDFCGFRTWRGRRFVRKHALYTFRRAARRGDAAAVASCIAHARRTSSHAGMQSFMDALRITPSVDDC